jgi:hypothetical protein
MLGPASLARAGKSITSGVKIEAEGYTGGCTSGPIAIPTAKKTLTYLLTAGHCLAKTGGVETIWKSDNKVIGPALPGYENGENGHPDYGAILIASAHQEWPLGSGKFIKGEWQTGKDGDPVKARMFNGTNTIKVTGEQKPQIGNKNCHVGYETPRSKSCGVIALLNWGPKYGFVEECGAKETTACPANTKVAESAPGDSGGPWFSEGNEGLMEGINAGRGEEVACAEVTGKNGGFPSYGNCLEWANLGTGAYYRTYLTGTEATQFEPLKQPVAGATPGALEALGLELLTTADEKRTSTCFKVAKTEVTYKGEKKEIYKGKYKNKACTELAPVPGKYYEGPEGKYEEG